MAVANPELVQRYLYQITEELTKKIITTRDYLTKMLHNDTVDGSSSPLLVLTGPSYITCPIQAKACANWLNLISVDNKKTNDLSIDSMRQKKLPKCIEDIYTASVNDGTKLNRQDILIAMRANLTKLNIDYDQIVQNPENPVPVKSFEIDNGIPICRSLLCELAEKVPLAGQISDTITPQYLSDLFCLSLVSSSLAESQLHREIVSGSSFPVGFHTYDAENQNYDFDSYLYKVKTAKESLLASKNPHHFLSVTKTGQVAILGTTGNDDTFIILKLNDGNGFELTNDELKQVFDMLKAERAKVMLDIGIVNAENFDAKLEILNELLVKDLDVSKKVLGVMINSGDIYVPQKCPTSTNVPADGKQSNIYNYNQQISLEDIRQLSNEDLIYSSLEEQLKEETNRSEISLTNDREERNKDKIKDSILSRFGSYKQKVMDLKKTFQLGSANKEDDIKEKVYLQKKFENMIYANKLIFEIRELSSQRAEAIHKL